MKQHFWENKNVVVTGGCGFIGSNLVSNLMEVGAAVTIIDDFSSGTMENIQNLPNDCRVIEADISKVSGWERELKNTDFVFHLAAKADIVPSIEEPVSYYEANVTGTLNVLQACREASIERLVYSASSSCYGIPYIYPTPETADTNPKYPYALTKYLGEQLVMHWADVYGLPAVSLRFFNVYGLNSRTNNSYGAMFGVFLAQKLAGVPLTIVGDGRQTRDFTYVSDVCGAMMECCFHDVCGQIFNIGSGKTVSVNKIVELLEHKSINIPKRPGEPDCTFADIEKFSSLTGWEPTVSIEEGVKLLLKNIDRWKDAPVWNERLIEKETEKWFEYLVEK